jgi:hypothetical protein
MMNDVIDLTVDMDATSSASDDESVVPAQRLTHRRRLSVRSLPSEDDVVLTTNATETISMEERPKKVVPQETTCHPNKKILHQKQLDFSSTRIAVPPPLASVANLNLKPAAVPTKLLASNEHSNSEDEEGNTKRAPQPRGITQELSGKWVSRRCT